MQLESCTMRRRFPLVALTLYAGAIVLFVASFGELRLYDGSNATPLDGSWSVQVRQGRVIASKHHLASSYLSRPSACSWGNAGGFSYEMRRFGNGGALGGKVMASHIAVPTYPLPLVGALLLAWRLRRYRLTQAPGRCRQCGYDLRATPVRCPECGAAGSAG